MTNMISITGNSSNDEVQIHLKQRHYVGKQPTNQEGAMNKRHAKEGILRTANFSNMSYDN